MYQAGDKLLYSRLLHGGLTDLHSVCGRLLGSVPALYRHRFHPSAIFIHAVTGSRLGGVTGGPTGGR